MRRQFGRSPRLWIVLVLVVLGAGCSLFDDGDDGGAGQTDGSLVGSSTSTEQESDTGGDSTQTGAAISPADDDLRYRCGGSVFGIDELLAAINGDPALPADLEAAGFVVADAGQWGLLPGPVAVEASPLQTTPPALVVAVPDAQPEACVAIRSGDYALRPVAFELVDGRIAIERCLEPADAVVDQRTVGGVTVVSVYGPPLTEVDCSVDRANVVDVEVSADAVSGLTFPFSAPDPAVNQILGFGAGVGQLDASLAADVTCAVESFPTEVFVQWDEPPPGFSTTLRTAGVELFTFEPIGLEGSRPLDEALNARRRELGLTAPDLDDVAYVDGFSDFAAPVGETRPYELILSGGAETFAVSCGEGGLTEEITPTTSTIPLAELGDLASAKALFDQRAIGPYAYFTVIPVCGNCSANPIDLQMAPLSGGTTSHQFQPTLAQQADTSLPGLVSPFELHELLAEAEDAGSEVEYEIDPSSGIPISWTVNGRGAQILCFEVDTAPPDLRDGASCGQDRDLIGRPTS